MNQEQQQKFFPSLQNDRGAVEQVFGPRSSSQLAQRIKREDPALYASLKSDANILGLIDTRTAPAPSSAFAGKLFQGGEPSKSAGTMSDAELQARSRFSEAECRKLFIESGTDAAAKLKRDNPNAYAQAKIAAASFGLLNPATLPQRPVQNSDFVGISQDLARRANLPPDLKVSLDQLDRLVQSVAAIEHAKDAA